MSKLHWSLPMRTTQKQGLVFPHQCAVCPVVIEGLDDFSDIYSRSEYFISGMCQNCQDEFFDESNTLNFHKEGE